MRYLDWLSLNIHLLWCHNLPVISGRQDRGLVLRSSEYINSGAWLVREGWAQVVHDGQSFRALPGQWLIVKPGPRVQTFSADARLISIAFDARWPDGGHLYDEGLSLVIDGKEVPALEARARVILNTMKQVNPDTWDARDQWVGFSTFLKLERLLFNWLDALATALEARGIKPTRSHELDERIRTVCDLMHAHELGEPFHAERMASAVGLSHNHLIRLFQRDLQCTPGQYWDRLRIEHARLRLLQPDSRVKLVAHELGFSYLSHFSKWFKRHTGKSPNVFRKENKRGSS